MKRVLNTSLEYFNPKEIPPEVEIYNSPTRQLAVGSPGKLGGLRLELSKDSVSGRTILKNIWKKIPLQVLKPFYYDESQPDLAIIYIMNPTGGILQGDRLRIDIELEANCKAHLTTQAATKIYRMNADYATQTINLGLSRGSYVEYLPDQIIPYRNSRFFQEVNVAMHPDSTFVYWEILTAGRKGREHFEFDVFYSKLTVRNNHGNPILSDTIVLEPKLHSLSRMGVMENYETLGNFYVLNKNIAETFVDRVHAMVENGDSDLLVGVGPTSLASGLVARVLGPSTRQVRSVLEKIWNESRVEVLGSSAPRIRK